MTVAAVAISPGGIVAWLVVGLLAGAIAGRIARGRGYGCLGDIVVGVVGAFLGGLIITPFYRGDEITGIVGSTAVALLGALALLLVLRLVRR
ncbi:MAG: hypothetical protein NVS2B16_13650 [Chloroflexota bacterium]